MIKIIREQKDQQPKGEPPNKCGLKLKSILRLGTALLLIAAVSYGSVPSHNEGYRIIIPPAPVEQRNVPETDIVFIANIPDFGKILIFLDRGFLNPENEHDHWITVKEFNDIAKEEGKRSEWGRGWPRVGTP